MKKMTWLLVLLALSAPLYGCGKKNKPASNGAPQSANNNTPTPGQPATRAPEAGRVGSCEVWQLTDAGTLHYCMDAVGAGITAEQTEQQCTQLGMEQNSQNTYSANPCMTEHRMGNCVVDTGTPDEFVVRFYEGFDASKAQAFCAEAHGQYLSD